MRIAQVSPLIEAVPPKLYGGTERVVSYLTEELVAQGHDVTLFASGDSETTARLVSVCDSALRLTSGCVDHLPYLVLLLDEVVRHWASFDVVHFHIDYIHYPWARRAPGAVLTTTHGRLDLPDLGPLYREFDELPIASISDAQRKPLPWLNWRKTVYHGLPHHLYRFHPEAGRYIAFLGRMSPEKGADKAIEIARRAGMPLKMAGKVDRADAEYFRTVIAPLLDPAVVEFIGEIGEVEKDEFLGGAAALLFPIDWPEPFGLVLIEALACGTPVVAFGGGSVTEIIDDGLTGYVVSGVASAVQAVGRLDAIDRADCRQVFERRFSSRRMAQDYLSLYRTLIASGPPRLTSSLDPVG